MKDNNCGNTDHALFQVLEACDKEITPNGTLFWVEIVGTIIERFRIL